MTESRRRYNRSTKTGPPNKYRGDATAKLDALAEGKKLCSRCKSVKERAEFQRSARHPTGLHSWCRLCCTQQKREHYQRERTSINLKRRAASYGVTVEALEALIDEHDGRCAICSGPCPSGRQLAVDHCHSTGQVRGLLCANCNRGIGLLQDSAAVARAAAEYLQRWESDAVESQSPARRGGQSQVPQ